ncbi:uncharacterized protein LOC122380872 [Amphibalanus amphitrite]|uniref:uncharacterized protein LOC122380872 n=1 Tax=Amphibalanus amphitrite TaxID=1232801 RepID=UPI001C90A335|nr:uncharacterized protein LOC122380872 [Amphibalanus amphitrite]
MTLLTDSCSPSENCSWTSMDTQVRINVISYRYCYPTISAAGIACSLALLVTLRRACFQAADVYTYLRCLMVSDCAVLALSGASMLADSALPTVLCGDRSFLVRSHLSAVWRVAFLPLVNSLIVFSMGVQLWMTLDRYLAVCAPRRRPARRRRRRLLLRVAATLLVALAMHAPLVLGYRVVRHCPGGRQFFEVALSGGRAQLGHAWTAYQWALQLLARWTPTGLLLYCNGYIIAAIRRRERRISATPRPASDEPGRPAAAPGQSAASEGCPGGDPQQQPRLSIISDSCQEGTTQQQQQQPRLSVVSDGCQEGIPQQQQQQQPQQPRLSVVSDSCLEGASPQQQRRRKRQEAGHRLELLLCAMGLSYLVANCLQMALFIAQYVYDQRNDSVQIFRAVANNYEALNFMLDSVFALAFLPQIRRESVQQLKTLFKRSGN